MEEDGEQWEGLSDEIEAAMGLGEGKVKFNSSVFTWEY